MTGSFLSFFAVRLDIAENKNVGGDARAEVLPKRRCVEWAKAVLRHLGGYC